jgi:hypothetical protein
VNGEDWCVVASVVVERRERERERFVAPCP